MLPPLPKIESPSQESTPVTSPAKQDSQSQSLGLLDENKKSQVCVAPESQSLGLLDDDEQTFILDTTLKHTHRNDPEVIRFIEAFMRCKNIKQASAEAGIRPEKGYLIRHRKDVVNCIQRLTDKSAMKYGFDASEIMERTKEIVDFDPIAIQNPDGTFKDSLHDLDPEIRRNIKKLKCKNLYDTVEDINGIKKQIVVGKVIEYEFYDKLKAIDLAGKEIDMFKNTTKVEHSITKDMATILLASVKRGEAAKLALDNAVETTGHVLDEEGE